MPSPTLRQLILLILLVIAPSARAAGPADELLRRVPADAGAALVVEDLSSRWPEAAGSSLVEGLKKLPAARSWMEGAGRAQFDDARREIERALGTDLDAIRDGLFGRAIVLSMHLPPGGRPDAAEGLLLLKVRDRALLDRLIRAVNDGQKGDGSLARVIEKKRGAAPYFVRQFQPKTKPDEAYSILDDGTFAWSNSERLVRQVLDGGRALADLAAFQEVRAGLPERSLASLYVDPRFLERMAPGDDDPASELVRRYVGAIDYAGAALQWRDGLVLHVHESIDPTKLDAPWTQWAARPGGAGPLIRRVPTSALAVAAGHVDFKAIAELGLGLVPEAQRPQLDNLRTALKGMLLGRDPVSGVLAFLGPGVVVYAEEPVGQGDSWRVPVVAAVVLGGDSGVGEAIDNALRTLLALIALDPKRGTTPPKVESRTIGSATVTTLSGMTVPLAYAVGRGTLVVGSSAESVAGYLNAEAANDSKLDRLRSTYFPEAETYGYLDLERLHAWAVANRDALAKRADHGADLDGTLALLGLFRAAYATSELAPDFTTAHRTIGLIAR